MPESPRSQEPIILMQPPPLDPPEPPTPAHRAAMNLWEHLGELRHRLIVCVSWMALGLIPGVFAVNPVIAWLTRPLESHKLVFVHPTEAFTAQIKIAVCVSFL